MTNEHFAKYRPELLAFRKWACEQFPGFSNHISQGGWDKGLYFQCYRAGAAASADRIRELEARVAELELFVAQIAHRFVPKKMPLGLLRANCWSESSQARALLKEPDQ